MRADREARLYTAMEGIDPHALLDAMKQMETCYSGATVRRLAEARLEEVLEYRRTNGLKVWPSQLADFFKKSSQTVACPPHTEEPSREAIAGACSSSSSFTPRVFGGFLRPKMDSHIEIIRAINVSHGVVRHLREDLENLRTWWKSTFLAACASQTEECRIIGPFVFLKMPEARAHFYEAIDRDITVDLCYEALKGLPDSMAAVPAERLSDWNSSYSVLGGQGWVQFLGKLLIGKSAAESISKEKLNKYFHPDLMKSFHKLPYLGRQDPAEQYASLRAWFLLIVNTILRVQVPLMSSDGDYNRRWFPRALLIMCGYTYDLAHVASWEGCLGPLVKGAIKDRFTTPAAAASAIAYTGEGIQFEIDICLAQQAVDFLLTHMNIEDALAWVADHSEPLRDLASYSPVVAVRKLLLPGGGRVKQATSQIAASGGVKKRRKT